MKLLGHDKEHYKCVGGPWDGRKYIPKWDGVTMIDVRDKNETWHIYILKTDGDKRIWEYEGEA